MPTLPEQDSNTNSSSSTSKVEVPPTFNLNVPIVHSLSSIGLQKLGWEKRTEDVTIFKQITFYTLGDKRVDYDGAVWKCNGRAVEYFEDLG